MEDSREMYEIEDSREMGFFGLVVLLVMVAASLAAFVASSGVG